MPHGSFHRNIEAQLERWKDSPSRQPLLLNGARQVGKTYILRTFGERCFDNVCYVNLELLLDVDAIFGKNIDPKQLVRRLEVSTGERIVAGDRLFYVVQRIVHVLPVHDALITEEVGAQGQTVGGVVLQGTDVILSLDDLAVGRFDLRLGLPQEMKH